MPRTEARIFTSIWRDDHFLALSVSAQRLYMFLLSQPDLTYCGVMPLRPHRWVGKASGLTLAAIEHDLKELEADERMFVLADQEHGELLIRTLLRRDGIWKQPNLLKQARESADQVESPGIRMTLCGELYKLPLSETPSEQVKTLVADFIADLEQGTAYPAANPGPNGSGDSPADPTGEDHACARGLGEGYSPKQGDSPDPLFPVSPGSPLAAQPAPSRRTGTRLPEDFALTAEMSEWGRANASHVNAEREFERFRDYWRAKAGKDGRKLDWLATWRNWMRTAEDRQGPRDRLPRNGSGNAARTNYTDEEYQRGFRRPNA